MSRTLTKTHHTRSKHQNSKSTPTVNPKKHATSTTTRRRPQKARQTKSSSVPKPSEAEPRVTATASISAELDKGIKLAVVTENTSKPSTRTRVTSSQTNPAVIAATALNGPIPDDGRTTLVVPPDFSVPPSLTNQVVTLSQTPSQSLQSIPTTPALLSLPILSLPYTDFVPFLWPTSFLQSALSSETFPSSTALTTSPVASASTTSSSSNVMSTTAHSTSASHNQSSPPIALIAGLVGSCVLLCVFGPCLVFKLLKFRRNRALVSPADFSPGFGGSKSFGSPVWGPALEKTLSNDSIEDEKNITSLFPNPPRPFVKQKLHPDIRMHISKPHPVVLPDFVSASYDDDVDERDHLKNNRTYERGEPQGPQNPMESTRGDTPQQPQVKVTGPTPSTSAESDILTVQPQPSRETERHVHQKIGPEDRTFSYVNFEDHIPSNAAPRAPPAPHTQKKSNLKKSTPSSSSLLQVASRKPSKKYRTEEEVRARDTKALTSALGLSSPPSPSLYSLSLSSAALLPPTEPLQPKVPAKPSGAQLNVVTPILTVRSPTMESLSPMGRYMLGEYDHTDSDVDNDGIEYRINPSPSPNTMSLTETHSNTGAVFDLIDTKARLKKRLSGISELDYTNGLDSRRSSRDVSGYAMMPEPPPRLPSPPPIPSLEQLALATENPDYRSPTYSMYGLYNSNDGQGRTSAGTSFFTSGPGGKKSFYPTDWKS